MNIAASLAAVRDRIARACADHGRDPTEVALLAVSKTRPAEDVRAAFAAGQLEFGENRVQELSSKAADLVDLGARWHQIGSIQTNKVRQLCAVPGLAVVHSVDRVRLVEKLAEAVAEMRATPLDVLIQVNASGEDTKHGVDPAATPDLAHAIRSAAPRLRLVGLMAMGPLDGDPTPCFASVARLRESLRDALGLPLPTLSLGMSGDLEAAVAAGSTMVRIGSAVFGSRG